MTHGHNNYNTGIFLQISKAAIKNYQIGRRIPHCGFELELLSEQVQRLRHKVVIKGIASPKDFHIRYPQPEGDKAGNYQPQTSIILNNAHCTHVVPYVSTAVSPLVQQPSAATLQTGPQQPSPLAPQRTSGKHSPFMHKSTLLSLWFMNIITVCVTHFWFLC